MQPNTLIDNKILETLWLELEKAFKNLPYLFVYKSENFVPNYCPKSWGQPIHEVALKV